MGTGDRSVGFEPMKQRPPTDILFVMTDLAVGGAENQVQELAVRLSARGWRVALTSMMPPDIPSPRLADAGVDVENLSMRRASWNPSAIVKLRRIIRRRRPGVVHSHMVHANLLTRITKPVSGMPTLICTSHNLHEGAALRTWAVRLTDRLSDMTTHVSRTGLARYLNERVAHPDRAMWIPNGIDLERFRRSESRRRAVRDQIGVSEDQFLWLTVGRLSKQKAHERLIAAFSAIPEAAVLALVGEGPLATEVEQIAARSSAWERIRFLGPRPDPEAVMSAADGFVLSSSWEGLPLVLMEAAACELPIVSTDVGGCRELVEDGTSGILVPSMEPSALADAMRDIMERSSTERAAMGTAGRALAEDMYDIERVVEEWEALYHSLGAVADVTTIQQKHAYRASSSADGVDLHGILVTYQRPELLERSLAAVASQRTGLGELVVVDNAPTNASTEIIGGFEDRLPKLTYISSPKNLGPAGGRWLGTQEILKRADATAWIVFLDDDDPLPTVHMLTQLASSIARLEAKDPNLAGVGLRGARLNRRTGRVKPVRSVEKGVRVDHLHGGFFPCYLVGALRRVGSFDPDLVFGFEELELGLRLTTAGYTLYADGSLYGPVEDLMGHREPLRRPRLNLASPSLRRYYSLRNQIYVLRQERLPWQAAGWGLVVGVLKPISWLLFKPKSALQHILLGLTAMQDARLGRLGSREWRQGKIMRPQENGPPRHV